jgi:hypothetical protein
MVNAMARSIPYLFNVILLMLLFFILFGLTGVELWGGALQRHCFDNSTGTPVFISVEDACRVNDAPSWLGGYYCDVDKQQVCGRSGQNPNQGMTHFDNFGAACLALFQSVTLEGWIFITYWMQDASVDVAALYFVLVPILGAFFFVNLFLATMQDSYSRSSDELDADDDDAVNEDGEAVKEDPKKPNLFNRFLEWLKRAEGDELKNATGIRGSLLRFADANVRNVLERGWFQNIREVLILVNSVVLGVKYYDMNPSALSVLRVINLVFLIIFSVEVFYHLVMRGLHAFAAKDLMNVMDAGVIILGWIQYGTTGGQIVGAFVVFRLFRVLRLFSYIKSWRKVNKVTAVVPKVLPFLFYSLVLMAVVIFIFAVLGMQLLGGKYTVAKFGADKPRLHYDSFWVAFVSTFCVVTFENWNGQMYDAVKASDSPAIALYFVAIIFAGNYIILNLFLSILLNAFGDALDDEEEDVFAKDVWKEGDDEKAIEADTEQDEKPTKSDENEKTDTELNVLDVTGKFIPTAATKGVASQKTIRGRQYEYVELDRGFATLGGKQKLGKIYDKSLFILPTSSAIRRYLFYITTSKIYIYTMNLLILLSLVTLMVESYYPSAPLPPAEPPVMPSFPDNSTAPVDPAPLSNDTTPVVAPTYAPPPKFLSALSNYNRVRSFLYAIDIVYAVIFAIEALMKILAQGFILHPRSYMRNFVNVFDLIAEIIMIIDIASWNRGIKIIKLLRFTRPVRLLFRLKQTRIMFVLFYRTLPSLPSVLPIGLIVWFVFAILGTQLYAGKFRSCNDATILTRELCNGTFINDDGVEKARDWEAPNDHYDHFFQAVFTIFKKSTGEGWPDVMFAGIDAPERVDIAPVRGRDPLSTVFFIAQVGFTAWFVLGLVFGAIVDTFNDLRKDRQISKHAGELLITDEQRQWVELQTMMVVTLPRKFREPPSNAFQRFFYGVATSKAFEYTMLVVIGLNTLLLCFNIYVQTENQDVNPWRTSQRYADFVFTSIYVVELLINLFAFGRYFFYDGWHILDFIIVIVSVVGWFVTFANLGKTFRVLRTLRIFKVTKSIKTLRILWRTMLRSIPAIFNVFLLLFLTFCAFAEVGVVLFRDLPDGDELNRRANFNTFWSALLLLLRSATGEAWDTVMHDVMRATSDWACIYFILFVVLINFIFLNVFTAVVVDSFQSVAAVDEHEVTIDDIEKFTEVWSEFDRQAMGRIHVKDLPAMIRKLGKPLGMKKSATQDEIKAYVTSLHMPVIRHNLYFPEVLLMLAQKAVGVDRCATLAHVFWRGPSGPNCFGNSWLFLLEPCENLLTFHSLPVDMLSFFSRDPVCVSQTAPRGCCLRRAQVEQKFPEASKKKHNRLHKNCFVRSAFARI